MCLMRSAFISETTKKLVSIISRDWAKISGSLLLKNFCFKNSFPESKKFKVLGRFP